MSDSSTPSPPPCLSMEVDEEIPPPPAPPAKRSASKSPTPPFATIKGKGKLLQSTTATLRTVTPPTVPDTSAPLPEAPHPSKVPRLQILRTTGHPLKGILKKTKENHPNEEFDIDQPSCSTSGFGAAATESGEVSVTFEQRRDEEPDPPENSPPPLVIPPDDEDSSDEETSSIRSVDSAYADTLVQVFQQYFMGLDIFLNICTAIGIYPDNITDFPADYCWPMVRSNSGDICELEPGIRDSILEYNKRFSTDMEARRDLRVPFNAEPRNVNMYEIINQLYLLSTSEANPDPTYTFEQLVYPYRCIWESSIFARTHQVRRLYFRDFKDLERCIRKIRYRGLLGIQLRTILDNATRFTVESIMEFMSEQRAHGHGDVEPFFIAQRMQFTYNGINRLFYLMVRWLQAKPVPVKLELATNKKTHSFKWIRKFFRWPRGRVDDPRPEMNF